MNAAPGAFSTVTEPPWATTTSCTIARPRPGATAVATARVVESREAFEDALPVGVGDAGSVVDDAQRHLGARLGERHRDLRVARGARRCRAGCAPRAATGRRCPSTCAPDTARVSTASARARVQSARFGEHDLVEVDGLAVRGVERRRVDHRDREQVVDQPLHADGVGEHAALGRLPIGELGVLEIDLELRPDPGERAAQLVAGVGDEAALAVGGVLEPREHRVHRAGQPTDLVLARRLGHPAVEVLGPPMSSTSRRIASTGRSARPVTTHVTMPIRATSAGIANQSRRTRLSVLPATPSRLRAT